MVSDTSHMINDVLGKSELRHCIFPTVSVSPAEDVHSGEHRKSASATHVRGDHHTSFLIHS